MILTRHSCSVSPDIGLSDQNRKLAEDNPYLVVACCGSGENRAWDRNVGVTRREHKIFC